MTLATWVDKTKSSVANEIFSHFLKGELAKYVEREREEEEEEKRKRKKKKGRARKRYGLFPMYGYLDFW